MPFPASFAVLRQAWLDKSTDDPTYTIEALKGSISFYYKTQRHRK